MNLKEYEQYLGRFLQNYLKKSHMNGYILGVSGGIDSAVVANLIAKYTKNSLALIMPINQNDFSDAIMVCKEANLSYKVVDLSEEYNLFVKKNFTTNNASLSNLKPRLRMMSLYYYGQMNNLLVIGTDNACEYYTGYFTKFGDGGYDINPLRHLNKGQVYELSRLLNVNKKIIEKVPSADLFENQTDEDELKVSYKELDAYLEGQVIEKEKANRIEYLHKISNHKRKLAVFPRKFK